MDKKIKFECKEDAKVWNVGVTAIAVIVTSIVLLVVGLGVI